MNKQNKTAISVRKETAAKLKPVGLKVRKKLASNHNANLLKIK